MNTIKHPCNFCGTPVELSLEKREHNCPGHYFKGGHKVVCRTRYIYRPTAARKPGRGYAKRQSEKV